MNKFTLSTVCLATMSVVLLVDAGTVLGQPVFHSEHEWTVEIGARRYGIERLIQNPGNWQQTQIRIVGRRFSPERNLEHRIVFAIPGMKTLYVAHTLSRFVCEIYAAGKNGETISTRQLTVLVRRLSLPCLIAQPPIIDVRK